VRFPVKLKYRGRVLARIYAKTPTHPYRLYWRVGRKSRIREFAKYADAKLWLKDEKPAFGKPERKSGGFDSLHPLH